MTFNNMTHYHYTCYNRQNVRQTLAKDLKDLKAEVESWMIIHGKEISCDSASHGNIPHKIEKWLRRGLGHSHEEIINFAEKCVNCDCLFSVFFDTTNGNVHVQVLGRDIAKIASKMFVAA